MSPETYLPTLAEVGITLAGFTGLIVTIRRGNSRPFAKHELLRVMGTITICLVTVLCSALPYALSGLPVAPHLKWSIPLLLSSGVVIVLFGKTIQLIIRGEIVFVASSILCWTSPALVAKVLR